MSEILTNKLIDFLKNANLSNYEIDAYISLLKSTDLTAGEIVKKSNVPVGRIYEVLNDLKEKGMIEIYDSRPKKYRSISFNQAFYNLISYQSSKFQQKTTFLMDQAKNLESELYDSDLLVKKQPLKIFWSTAFGLQSILNLYLRQCSELKEELLMSNFINENTIKILSYSRKFFYPITEAIDRGIKVKMLWSFEFDDRPLTTEQKSHNKLIFDELLKRLEELYNISIKRQGFEAKYVNKKIPTYFDIFDKKRVLVKLQNPLKPYQIFTCLDVLDLNLAKELREKFLNIWLFEAIE